MVWRPVMTKMAHERLEAAAVVCPVFQTCSASRFGESLHLTKGIAVGVWLS